MFYVALIVLLLCLLITLYFHHKYMCNEIEELKELIKNIKLSDSNNSINLLHSNNEPKKDTIKPIDELIESNEEIKQSLKPNYSKFINVPIIEHKEDNINDNITNNSSDKLNKPIDKLPNDQMIKESNNENISNNEVNKANEINNSDKQLPSLIDSEDDLVIPKIINPNSFEYPTLNELEQQVLNQITNEINNGITIINESLGIPEINKHPRVEEVSDEEPINDNKVDNKNEIFNYEISENIINDVLNDIKMQEVNNQNDNVKDEEVKDNIKDDNKEVKDDIKDDNKEIKDDISTNDSVTKESLNQNPEVKESNESKPKIDSEVINDLLNGNYKYLQLVKKCKELGIDVAKKKKEEIFKILKSYL